MGEKQIKSRFHLSVGISKLVVLVAELIINDNLPLLFLLTANLVNPSFLKSRIVLALVGFDSILKLMAIVPLSIKSCLYESNPFTIPKP